MAIADEVLSLVKDEGLQLHSADVGSYFIKGLRALMEKHQSIGAVRGFGLFVVLEFVQDRLTHDPDTELAEDVKW